MWGSYRRPVPTLPSRPGGRGVDGRADGVPRVQAGSSAQRGADRHEARRVVRRPMRCRTRRVLRSAWRPSSEIRRGEPPFHRAPYLDLPTPCDVPDQRGRGRHHDPVDGWSRLLAGPGKRAHVVTTRSPAVPRGRSALYSRNDSRRDTRRRARSMSPARPATGLAGFLQRNLSLLYAAGVLGAFLQISGGTWDVASHSLGIPDTFFTPSHSILYAGVGIAALAGLGGIVLRVTAFRARPPGRAPL